MACVFYNMPYVFYNMPYVFYGITKTEICELILLAQTGRNYNSKWCHSFVFASNKMFMSGSFEAVVIFTAYFLLQIKIFVLLGSI